MLPFVATLLAFSIAVNEGQFGRCNPLIDGCVSISRAARYGLPNYVFRALVFQPPYCKRWYGCCADHGYARLERRARAGCALCRSLRLAQLCS